MKNLKTCQAQQLFSKARARPKPDTQGPREAQARKFQARSSSKRDGIYRAGIVYINLLVSNQPSPFHDFHYIFIFNSTQHLNTLQIPVDLVFVLKWVKCVIGCALYIFHLYGLTQGSGGCTLVVNVFILKSDDPSLNATFEIPSFYSVKVA